MGSLTVKAYSQHVVDPSELAERLAEDPQAFAAIIKSVLSRVPSKDNPLGQPRCNMEQLVQAMLQPLTDSNRVRIMEFLRLADILRYHMGGG